MSDTTPRKPRLKTSAMIASIAGEGQVTRSAPVRPRARTLAREQPNRRHDRRPRQVHRHARLRKKVSRALFPDGHGRADADGCGRRLAHEGAQPFVTTYCVFATRRAYDFIPGDRRRRPRREDRLRAARPHDRLRSDPPGAEDLASCAPCRHDVIDPCDAPETSRWCRRSPPTTAPCNARLLRGNVPAMLDDRLPVRNRQGPAAARRRRGAYISSGIMTMRALERPRR